MLSAYSAGGEDDFEMFLESVKARSLKATAHLRKGGNNWYSFSCRNKEYTSIFTNIQIAIFML